jgi:hypothetical protein
MSTAADSKPRPAAVKPRTPPPETFWKRYSRHGEFPLSTVVSASLHVLLGGVLILGALFLWGPEKPKPLPTEAVRLAGGGGPKDGKKTGPGRNTGEVGEETPDDKRDPTLKDDAPQPTLDAAEIAKNIPAQDLTPDVKRRIDTPGANLTYFKDINTAAGKKLKGSVQAQQGAGEGGPGRDGGKDKGRDKGEGDHTGPGKESGLLNEREKFLERCDMKFVTSGPGDYFRQLDALGAILAIPTPDGNDYIIIHNSAKSGVKNVKSISELNRVYWKDYRPDSVREMMMTLKRREQPSHFVAFMPEELENHLRDMEKQRAESRGKAVKDILKTTFRVIKRGGGYNVELADQTYF